MPRSIYPRLSAIRPYPRRNQFGRTPRQVVLQCACCKDFASSHVVLQTSLFRSEDMNLWLCATHAELARREEWRRLFASMLNQGAEG